ncbi:MAG: molybdopterin-binding protein [Verrucomicrobiota bacterium]
MHIFGKQRLSGLLCLALLVVAAHGATLGASTNDVKAVNYFLVVTGTELLEGTIQDAHTQFITRTLHPLGLNCVGSILVDDVEEEICAALRFATNRASLVFVTGGLGPTDNDITRQTLSKFTGIPLQENPDLLLAMSQRHRTPVEKLRANMRRQTQVPIRGGYLKNPFGTAAGLMFDCGTVHVIALPGPPRELQPMVQKELVPMLVQHYGIRPNAASVTLRFVGLGQSQIDHTIKQHVVPPANLITASLFDAGRVDFIFSLPEDSPGARQSLDEFKGKIRECLSTNLYSDDGASLEEMVVRGLQQHKVTLALGEIGSGGALAAALAKVPDTGPSFCGSWVAAGEAELYRVLETPKEEQADAGGLAALKYLVGRIARVSGGDYVLVIGPGKRDEAGGTTVQAMLKAPGHHWNSETFTLRGSAESAQAQLVTQLLAFLWQQLR